MINRCRKMLLSTILGTVCVAPMVFATPMDENTITQTLIKMESPAEDMLDAMDAKDMNKLNQLYNKLNVTMFKLNQLTTTENIPAKQSREIALQNSWFYLISLEMKELDDFAALTYDINQFSGQLIIATRFKYDYDKNVAWMDYLGREILLLNKYPSDSGNHEILIKIRKIDLQKTWNKLKTLIAKRKNRSSLIHKVDPVIHSIMVESRPDKLVALSVKELDLVDNIEEYFHIN